MNERVAAYGPPSYRERIDIIETIDIIERIEYERENQRNSIQGNQRGCRDR